MSSELERLTTDLDADASLAEELQGLEEDPAVWAQWAVGKGYQITAEEAAEGLQDYYDQLSDDDLEQAAGGWTGG